MGETYRVMEHPILEELREPDTYIIYDGKKIPAVSGEPVAAALLAAGVRIMRHTEKKDQPRGIFCGIGRCNDCKMVVDGVPNTRTCVTPVREGMVLDNGRDENEGSRTLDCRCWSGWSVCSL